MPSLKKGLFSKKKSSFGSGKSNISKRNIKIFSSLIILISIFLFVALISYSYEDESNIQMNFSEVIGLATGDDIAQIKAETTNNWLGLFGAFISYYLYNHTFGYIMILLPFILFYTGWELLKNGKINEYVIKYGIYFILACLAFSGFMGTIYELGWISPFPREWSGSIGLYLSYLTSSLIGSFGAFLIFLAGITAIVIFTFNIDTDKLIKSTTSTIKGVLNKIKENQSNKKKGTTPTKNKKSKKVKQKKEVEEKYEDEDIENPTEEYYSKKSLNLSFNRGDQPEPYENIENNSNSNDNSEVEERIETNDSSLNLTSDSELTNSKDIDDTNEDFGKATNPISVEDLDDNRDSPLGTAIHDENINYDKPGFDLLENSYSINEVNEEELKTNAEVLRDKLETFKITIENLSVTPGPVVTQYEFVPAAGIKISKIENLSDDLAMALKAKGIRIIAPIPGRGTVGIEIPNSDPSIVSFSSVVNTKKFKESQFHLPLALGKTISGDVYLADLAKMPHLLIAGSTGSGKSVGINTIIASLLYKKNPDELKFVIIDPKKVELTQYQALNYHYLAATPDVKDLIITDPSDAVAILKSLVMEMEERYDILSRLGQRNIHDYNKKVKEGKFEDDPEMKHRPMPFIVCVIDELADLMLTASKEIEEPIIRLAQMARAVGIHMILATQRPSVDVITGIIKANFPARIGYLVASKIDSRTILDVSGAEKLLGNGDLLYLSPGSPKPIRVQNSYISTDEIENICEHISSQQGYTIPYQLPSLNKRKEEYGGIAPSERDDLFEDAARIIIRQQQGSVSLLQRKLKVGYARAGKIVDELEAAGVVGPYNGSKARDVLMDSESELESVL